MLNERVQLRIEDIAKAPGNIYDNIQTQILTNIITDAIRRAYPTAVDGVFKSDASYKYPRMPQLDLLKSARTTHITIGPILDSEALISSNYRVLETIFREQLDLKCDAAFKDCLYLVYRD